MMSMRKVAVGASLALAMLVSGCVGVNTFRTYYDAPVSSQMSKGWRVTDVRVLAPRSLVASEERSLAPDGDIIWREDPPGDRHKQVEGLVRDAVRQGARGLRGQRAVRLEVTITKFHALTFEAEALRYDVGVHNVDFIIRAVDARSGAVLAGPTAIEAALPAMTGGRMIEARMHGQTQRSQISAHLRKVVAGWLGAGPDPRATFERFGR
jgi:hypothetical protein